MYRFEITYNGYRFSRRDIQLLIALTLWTKDANGQPLSDGTKSQVMLWRRSWQGTLPIAGLFDAVMNSRDPDERGWVESVLNHQAPWENFAQQQYESLEEALYIKHSRAMVSSEQWRRLVDHEAPASGREGTLSLGSKSDDSEKIGGKIGGGGLEDEGCLGNRSSTDYDEEDVRSCAKQRHEDLTREGGSTPSELEEYEENDFMAKSWMMVNSRDDDLVSGGPIRSNVHGTHT